MPPLQGVTRLISRVQSGSVDVTRVVLAGGREITLSRIEVRGRCLSGAKDDVVL